MKLIGSSGNLRRVMDGFVAKGPIVYGYHCNHDKMLIYILLIHIFLYKIKNCKNNCKMWRIGNCFLSALVHIPPNEIPHQTPGSH